MYKKYRVKIIYHRSGDILTISKGGWHSMCNISSANRQNNLRQQYTIRNDRG